MFGNCLVAEKAEAENVKKIDAKSRANLEEKYFILDFIGNFLRRNQAFI